VRDIIGAYEYSKKYIKYGVIIISVLLAGFIIFSQQRVDFSNQGKYVEVKGLSEKIVKSRSSYLVYVSRK
jgi:hypothetical protein